jgi:hypothetical protein
MAMAIRARLCSLPLVALVILCCSAIRLTASMLRRLSSVRQLAPAHQRRWARSRSTNACPWRPSPRSKTFQFPAPSPLVLAARLGIVDILLRTNAHIDDTDVDVYGKAQSGISLTRVAVR